MLQKGVFRLTPEYAPRTSHARATLGFRCSVAVRPRFEPRMYSGGMPDQSTTKVQPTMPM